MGSKFFGRKKEKNIEEEDKLVEALLEEPKKEVVEEINLTPAPTSLIWHKAHNLYYDSKLKMYMIVTVEYDPVTKATRFVSQTPEADDIRVGLYKLQGLFNLKVYKQEEQI